MTQEKSKAWPSIAAFCLLIASCSTQPVSRLERAQHTKHQYLESAELTVAQADRMIELCPFGVPQKAPGWEHGFTEYVVRDGYALEHSGDLKIPLWVCERLTPAQLESKFDRTDRFRADPELSGPRAELGDYRLSGYARGHHSPAENHAWDERLLDETFYLSNMSPQLGGFNSGVWSQVEKRVRVMAASVPVTWVITGAMLYDPREESVDTADGWIEYVTIGSGVAVPTHLYKIVVSEHAEGESHVVAFVIANQKPPSPYTHSKFVQTVRWIEERTGFDFMPDLEPGAAERLETQIGVLDPP